MQVPKKIREAIIKCANYNNKAKCYEQIILDWLTNNKLTQETCEDITKDMEDSFIDFCQLTYNPEKFIKRLEEL